MEISIKIQTNKNGFNGGKPMIKIWLIWFVDVSNSLTNQIQTFRVKVWNAKKKKKIRHKKPLNQNHWIYDSTYVSICRYIVKFDHKTYDNNIDHLYAYHTDYIDKGSRIY